MEILAIYRNMHTSQKKQLFNNENRNVNTTNF